jgi:hypothetical protein
MKVYEQPGKTPMESPVHNPAVSIVGSIMKSPPDSPIKWPLVQIQEKENIVETPVVVQRDHVLVTKQMGFLGWIEFNKFFLQQSGFTSIQ